MIDSGEIPVNVSVNVLARVTAGFANEVDDVKKLNIYRKVRDDILDFILNISNYI